MGADIHYCQVCGLPFRHIAKFLGKTKWLNNAVLKYNGERVLLEANGEYAQFKVKEGMLPEGLKTLVKIEGGDRISLAALDLEHDKKGIVLCHAACEHRGDKAKVKVDVRQVWKYQEGQYFDDGEFVKNNALKYLMTEPKPSGIISRPHAAVGMAYKPRPILPRDPKPASPPTPIVIKPPTPPKVATPPAAVNIIERLVQPLLGTPKAKIKKPRKKNKKTTVVVEKPKTLDSLTVKELHKICDTLHVKKPKVKAAILKEIRDFVCPALSV